MHFPSILLRYGYGLLLVALVTLFVWPLRSIIGAPSILLAYLLGVFLAAYRLGLGPSILAAVLSALAFAFFFAPPIFSFAISDLQNLLGLMVMLTVATVTSGLAGKLREQAAISDRRQRQAVVLYQLTEDFSNSQSVKEAVQLVPRHFRAGFDADAFIVLKTSDDPHEDDVVGQHPNNARFSWDRRISDQFLKGASAKNLSCVDEYGSRQTLLMSAQAPLGVLVTEPGFSPAGFDAEGKSFFANFQKQVTHHLERLKLAEEKQRVQMQIESESIRNSLLSGISHDLRTPLTRILGAASALALKKMTLSEMSKDELTQQIQDEARHMADVMNKVLEMARLAQGDIQPNLEWNDLEEIVGSSIARLEPSLSGWDLRLSMAPNLPLIWVDAVLLQQVLVNLIENVTKYCPVGSSIELSARLLEDGSLIVEVIDQGPGITSAERERIFRKFTRLDSESATTGVGLGLSLCRTIIELHGGELDVRPAQGGGAVFFLIIPTNKVHSELS